MKNGTKSKKVVKRGIKHYPVDYKVKLSIEVQQSEELGGMMVASDLVLPIRRGAGARLSKYKKEDVAGVLRQLAEVIEKGDYSALGPDLYTQFEAARAASAARGKTGTGAN